MRNLKSTVNLKTTLTTPSFDTPTTPVASVIESASFWRYARYGFDLVLIYAAFLVAYYLRYNWLTLNGEMAEQSPVTPTQYLAIGALYTATLLGALAVKKLYTRTGQTRSLTNHLLLVGNAVITSTAIVTLFMLIVRPEIYVSRLLFVYLVPITWLVLSAEHIVAKRIQQVLWSRGIGVRNLIVVGATDTGVSLMRNLTAKSGLGYNLVGFVDDQLRYSDWTLPARYGCVTKRSNREVPHLGQISQLSALIAQHGVSEVIVALPMDHYQALNSVVGQCRDQNVTCNLIPNLSAIQVGGVGVREINGMPLIVTDRAPVSAPNQVIKRLVDIAGSLTLILAASIPLIILALAVKLDSKGPIIFRQTRIGKNGKPFTFYKFRSMYTDAEARLAELQGFNETSGATFKMKNDPRVTRVGRLIRRTSLDELPQLFNVLLGQMTLVGPRPGLAREVACYQPWQFRRLEVTPGLTGLWQVSGRSSTTFDEMVKLDIYYVEHWSLLLDIKILFRTINAVIKGDGAY